MGRFVPLLALMSFTVLGALVALPARATTFDLPLNGSISIVDTAVPSGPIAIGIEAVESFTLPVFNQQNRRPRSAFINGSPALRCSIRAGPKFRNHL